MSVCVYIYIYIYVYIYEVHTISFQTFFVWALLLLLELKWLLSYRRNKFFLVRL